MQMERIVLITTPVRTEFLLPDAKNDSPRRKMPVVDESSPLFINILPTPKENPHELSNSSPTFATRRKNHRRTSKDVVRKSSSRDSMGIDDVDVIKNKFKCPLIDIGEVTRKDQKFKIFAANQM